MFIQKGGLPAAFPSFFAFHDMISWRYTTKYLSFHNKMKDISAPLQLKCIFQIVKCIHHSYTGLKISESVREYSGERSRSESHIRRFLLFAILRPHVETCEVGSFDITGDSPV